MVKGASEKKKVLNIIIESRGSMWLIAKSVFVED
jgi:hypothetical protein